MNEDLKDTPSPEMLADEAGTIAVDLVGDGNWQGSHPYEINAVDGEKFEAYQIEIRRGDDWVTISERMADNPMLKRFFQLKLVEDRWTWEDPYLVKHGEGRPELLAEMVQRLRKIQEISKPKPLAEEIGDEKR